MRCGLTQRSPPEREAPLWDGPPRQTPVCGLYWLGCLAGAADEALPYMAGAIDEAIAAPRERASV